MRYAANAVRLLLAGLVFHACGGKLLPTAATTIASNQSSPSRVALDDASIYWTNSGAAPVPSPANHLVTLLPHNVNGAIMKAPLGGGTATTLAFTADNNPSAIAVAGGSIYWSSDLYDVGSGQSNMVPLGGSVVRASLDGSSATTLVHGQGHASGIVADLSGAFWTHYGAVIPSSPTPGPGQCWCGPAPCSNPCFTDGDGAVIRAPQGGGTTTVASAGNDAPSGITRNDKALYWTNRDAGTVVMMSLADGKQVVLADGQIQPTDIAVDEASVYWCDVGTGNAHDGAIVKVALAGGAAVTLARAQAPAGIALDSRFLYWTNASTVTLDGSVLADGTVRRVPLEGGRAEILADGQANPMGIAVNATSLYWANNGTTHCESPASCEVRNDGTIMRLTPK